MHLAARRGMCSTSVKQTQANFKATLSDLFYHLLSRKEWHTKMRKMRTVACVCLCVHEMKLHNKITLKTYWQLKCCVNADQFRTYAVSVRGFIPIYCYLNACRKEITLWIVLFFDVVGLCHRSALFGVLHMVGACMSVCECVVSIWMHRMHQRAI